MLRSTHRRTWILIGWFAVGLAVRTAAADPPEKPAAVPANRAAVPEKPATKTDVESADKLALEQQRLADRYKQLEDVLLRMSELTVASDPRRAALLKKAVAQSKEQLIALQFEQTGKLLEKDQLSRAIENQGQLEKDLNSLLELLMSENRAKRIESEKARIAAYLKRLNQLIADQKSVQGRTGSAQNPKSLSPEQQKLAEKTGGLSKDIRANEEGSQGKSGKSDKPGEGQPKSEQPKAEKAGEKNGEKASPKEGSADKGKPQQGKPGEGKPSEGKSSEGKPSEGKPSEKSSDGKAQPGQGKPQSGQSQDQGQQGPNQEKPPSPSDEQQNPARQQLDEAQKRMDEAKKKLDEAKRTDAVAKQEEAIRELEQAKAALEEILRQLREEEKERSLAMLEARFLRMLQLQRQVLDGTVRLDKVPLQDRTHTHEIESGRLSTREMEIVVEADKALLLLHEDGTAVAFPEALGQARQDMQQVVQRLSAAKVDKITQGVEEDIIAALQEMLDAVKKAQKKQEQNKQSRPSRGQPQEPSLVDAASELRMIRALQLRVNTRTERYRKMIDGEQAEKDELVEAVRRLSESQQKIFRITRDLDLGKNQ
jgi:hypothetical protein